VKALPVEELPEGDWLYEIKHDGYRALGFKDGREVRLVSRNKKTFDYRCRPTVLSSMAKLPRWTRKAALRSSVFSYSKSLEAYHWSITSSICCSWKEKICVKNR
jgi:ATP-dependent DNA ligase